MILVQLFFSFLQIGMFSFGGGYAALSLIQDQVITTHHWLSMGEFSDLVTISQMTPGPIAVNAATFVGTKIAGTTGAIVATIGCILPSCIIVTLIAYFYLKYRNLRVIQVVLNTLRPAVIALIFAAGVSILVSALFQNGIIGIETIKIQMTIIFVVSMYLLIKHKMNPIVVMVFAGICNVLQYYIMMCF